MKVTDCTVKYDLEGRCELCFMADRQSLQECRVGVETMTPEELSLLKETWRN